MEKKFSKEHEWITLDGEVATIGITDHAQKQLTDIVFVELPEVGKEVTLNGNLGVVESVKSVSDIFSPISGTVVEVNKDLEKTPQLINEDPYSKGWIAKIKIKEKAELDSLMSKEEYEKLISEEK